QCSLTLRFFLPVSPLVKIIYSLYLVVRLLLLHDDQRQNYLRLLPLFSPQLQLHRKCHNGFAFFAIFSVMKRSLAVSLLFYVCYNDVLFVLYPFFSPTFWIHHSINSSNRSVCFVKCRYPIKASKPVAIR